DPRPGRDPRRAAGAAARDRRTTRPGTTGGSPQVTKVGARLAAAVVAAVAGVISYGHIRSVALAVGESHVAAALLPIGVDGLIIVATLAMLEDAKADRHPRLSARFALAA